MVVLIVILSIVAAFSLIINLCNGKAGDLDDASGQLFVVLMLIVLGLLMVGMFVSSDNARFCGETLDMQRLGLDLDRVSTNKRIWELRQDAKGFWSSTVPDTINELEYIDE